VEDCLVRIDFPDGSYAAYTYDRLGRRLSKRDRSGATTYYIYEGADLVQEVNDGGVVIAGYVYDGLDHPLSMTRGGTTYYYLYDRLDSVVGLTDGAGGVVASYRYDPWGNVIATGGSNPALANPFRFAGREWDAESGLYYFRARYYDAGLGRFISPDPRTGASGPDYAYAMNNPLADRDPLGLYSYDAEQLAWLLMHIATKSEVVDPELKAWMAAKGLVDPNSRAALEAVARGARYLRTAIAPALRWQRFKAALASLPTDDVQHTSLARSWRYPWFGPGSVPGEGQVAMTTEGGARLGRGGPGRER
jgi:RHS repeat-associated protein